MEFLLSTPGASLVIFIRLHNFHSKRAHVLRQENSILLRFRINSAVPFLRVSNKKSPPPFFRFPLNFTVFSLDPINKTSTAFFFQPLRFFRLLLFVFSAVHRSRKKFFHAAAYTFTGCFFSSASPIVRWSYIGGLPDFSYYYSRRVPRVYLHAYESFFWLLGFF